MSVASPRQAESIHSGQNQPAQNTSNMSSPVAAQNGFGAKLKGMFGNHKRDMSKDTAAAGNGAATAKAAKMAKPVRGADESEEDFEARIIQAAQMRSVTNVQTRSSGRGGSGNMTRTAEVVEPEVQTDKILSYVISNNKNNTYGRGGGNVAPKYQDPATIEALAREEEIERRLEARLINEHAAHSSGRGGAGNIVGPGGERLTSSSKEKVYGQSNRSHGSTLAVGRSGTDLHLPSKIVLPPGLDIDALQALGPEERMVLLSLAGVDPNVDLSRCVSAPTMTETVVITETIEQSPTKASRASEAGNLYDKLKTGLSKITDDKDDIDHEFVPIE